MVGLTLNQVLANIAQSMPAALAVGVVDTCTGMLLGVETRHDYPQDLLDLLAAATCDLFQGHHVAKIEALFGQGQDTEDEDGSYYREVVIISTNVVHMFVRGRICSDEVLVVVTRLEANLGMAIAMTRRGLIEVEAAT